MFVHESVGVCVTVFSCAQLRKTKKVVAKDGDVYFQVVVLDKHSIWDASGMFPKVCFISHVHLKQSP